MKKSIKHCLFLSGWAVMTACTQQTAYTPGTYGYDAAFLKEQGVTYRELVSEDGKSKVMIVPAWQGRVLTSSASGDGGDSYGWINYDYIKAGKLSSQFNPFGGEERFWLGPEGGDFSLYFKKGMEQVYKNWQVPSVLDTEAFDVKRVAAHQIQLTKQTTVTNASDTPFHLQIDRTVSLLDAAQVTRLFQIKLPSNVQLVAYKSDNRITNISETPWIKEKGLISIWMLGCFNPTPTTTVFIPYHQQAEGNIVKDDYFGKIPSDRLVAEDGIIYFKIDGKYRAKIGLSAQRQKGLCGSFDSAKNMLTILRCNQPDGPADYVNGQWGEQADPYHGDVINSYNDGPVEDGSIMGPFYEIETSSPGADLKPGESLTHSQTVVHLQADYQTVSAVAKKVFGVDLNIAKNKFK